MGGMTLFYMYVMKGIGEMIGFLVVLLPLVAIANRRPLIWLRGE